MDNPFPVIFVVVIGVIALIVYLDWRARKKRQEIIANAKWHYNKALDDLRKDPSNSQKRERALALGREYADLVREDKRTMFDEVALMNDLNAIQPATTTKADDVRIYKPSVTTDGTEQRLTKLDDLKSKGLITEDEYQKRRAAILDEI